MIFLLLLNILYKIFNPTQFLQAAVDDVIGQVNTQITDIKEKVMGVIPMKNNDAMKKEE